MQLPYTAIQNLYAAVQCTVIYERYSLKCHLRYLRKSILGENGKYKENKQAKNWESGCISFWLTDLTYRIERRGLMKEKLIFCDTLLPFR
jgi:hypothetical protein